MDFKDASEAAQVAHLFLKASDQGVITPDDASATLRSIFPDLFRPEAEIDAAKMGDLVDEVIRAADRVGPGVHLSAHLKESIEALRFYRAASTAASS